MCPGAFPDDDIVPQYTKEPYTYPVCSSHTVRGFEHNDFITFYLIYLILHFTSTRRHIMFLYINYNVLFLSSPFSP